MLAAIGRKHAAADVLRAFDEARQAGFREINMDVIAGLTGDTPETFAHTIDTLHRILSPENITVHTLAIKRGADTDRRRRRPPRSARRSLSMLDYVESSHALQNAGYGSVLSLPPEIHGRRLQRTSAGARPGTECFYNVTMMEELQTIPVARRRRRFQARRPRYRLDRAREQPAKYPLEYIRAADRLANGKRKLLFPRK
ncbi:MAG: hypothetical protein ACLR4Z_01755 [Butyricicoccaceae bacterium]